LRSTSSEVSPFRSAPSGAGPDGKLGTGKPTTSKIIKIVDFKKLDLPILSGLIFWTIKTLTCHSGTTPHHFWQHISEFPYGHICVHTSCSIDLWEKIIAVKRLFIV
jgi:hypothetical protein